jgi:hypothetical protein
MSYPLLPATIVLGNKVKERVQYTADQHVYVYSVHRIGASPGALYYETVRTKTGQYPTQPGRNLVGKTRLYDALVQYTVWAKIPALQGIPTVFTTPSNVDTKLKNSETNSTLKGGSNAE